MVSKESLRPLSGPLERQTLRWVAVGTGQLPKNVPTVVIFLRILDLAFSVQSTNVVLICKFGTSPLMASSFWGLSSSIFSLAGWPVF